MLIRWSTFCSYKPLTSVPDNSYSSAYAATSFASQAVWPWVTPSMRPSNTTWSLQWWVPCPLRATASECRHDQSRCKLWATSYWRDGTAGTGRSFCQSPTSVHCPLEPQAPRCSTEPYHRSFPVRTEVTKGADSVCPPIHPSICPPVCLSACPSIKPERSDGASCSDELYIARRHTDIDKDI